MSEPLSDEVLDGVPVLPDDPSSASMFAKPESRPLPAVLGRPGQTVVAAAGGFVAGAALLGVVHYRHGKRATLGRARSPRRLARSGKGSRSVGDLAIVGSRSLLVDVHLLGTPLRGR